MFEINNCWLWQTSVGCCTWNVHVQSETFSCKRVTPVFFRKKCCRLDGLQATIKMMMTLTFEVKQTPQDSPTVAHFRKDKP